MYIYIYIYTHTHIHSIHIICIWPKGGTFCVERKAPTGVKINDDMKWHIMTYIQMNMRVCTCVCILLWSTCLSTSRH